MADNFAINEATSGTITYSAADDVGGVKYPRVKSGFGVDGAYADVSATDPLPICQAPKTSGGLTRYHLKSAATTNGTSVKGSAGQVYKAHAFNAAGATKYLKFYDKAGAPTVGVDTPVEVHPLEAGKLTKIEWEGFGMPFASGIALAITGGVADGDTTAVAANDVILNMGYK